MVWIIPNELDLLIIKFYKNKKKLKIKTNNNKILPNNLMECKNYKRILPMFTFFFISI